MLTNTLLGCTNCLCILPPFKQPQEALEVLLSFVGALPADAGTKVVLAKHWILYFFVNFFTFFIWSNTFLSACCSSFDTILSAVGLVLLAGRAKSMSVRFWVTTSQAAARATSSSVFFASHDQLVATSSFFIDWELFSSFCTIIEIFYINTTEHTYYKHTLGYA